MAHEQRMEALAKANAVRYARSAVKRALAAGEITLAEALADPACENMLVADVLKAQHRWGKARVRRAMREAQIAPTAVVWRLTARQIHALTSSLPRMKQPPFDLTNQILDALEVEGALDGAELRSRFPGLGHDNLRWMQNEGLIEEVGRRGPGGYVWDIAIEKAA